MDEDFNRQGVEVYRGSRSASVEYGLVLEAKSIGYERVETDGGWALLVAPALVDVAAEELQRYSQERAERAPAPPALVLFPGAALGSGLYALVLIVVAYCNGIDAFGGNWLALGAIESRGPFAGDWWRPITALTLHLDQEHLLGNLLFGVAAGTLAGRMFGPGMAWLCILAAAATANTADMWLSPPGHRSAGASTAVFAALGLLAGFGWAQRLTLRARRFYRWAPLFAGLCLLALLGAGANDARVDVLGHLLGFAMGVLVGCCVEWAGWPRAPMPRWQRLSGAVALLATGSAWFFALRAA